MSAIAGLVAWDGQPSGEAVRAATESLHLHGRDGQGLWESGSASLGWRQTILHEEDHADNQPRGGISGVRLVFDGRIDNRSELTRQLGLDAAARLWSDSAFVLAAFEKWGIECCERLLGDYAFAVWDPAANKLTLARDHLGMRPLFFHRQAGFVMFASMPSALFTNARVPMDIDDEKLVFEISAIPKAPWETFYAGIERVQPGHAIVFERASSSVYRHWRPETVPELRYRRDEDYVDAFRQILSESVSACLRTIHPVGSHLSSGWDSSTVTATAASLLAGSARGLTAFTAVPPANWQPGSRSTSFLTNEAPLAAEVAAHFPNIEHVLVEGLSALDLTVMDRHGYAFEHPKNPVVILGWHERLHYLARQRGVRVMLAGYCGNRTISCSGMESLSALFRKGQWRSLFREWMALRKAGQPTYRLASYSIGPYLPEFIWPVIRRIYGVPDPTLWMNLGMNPRALPAGRLREVSRMRSWTPATAHRMDDRDFREFCTTTPDFGITWGAHLAAYDIDCRDPSADRRLLTFRAGIPESQFLHSGHTKWLLRRAMAGVLPVQLMDQRIRGLQAAEWFDAARSALSEITEEVERIAKNPRLAALFDVPLLRRLMKNWPATPQGRLNEVSYRRLLIIVGWARFMRHFLYGAAQR